MLVSRREMRRSLGTKNVLLARALASGLNGVLELTGKAGRTKAVEDFLLKFIPAAVADADSALAMLQFHDWRPGAPAPQYAGHSSIPVSASLPPQPLRLYAALIKYGSYYSQTLKTQSRRTHRDKKRLYSLLNDFLHSAHPELGPDPWVHEITASHVKDFLHQHAVRPSKRSSDVQATAAPATLLKKLSDIGHLFDYLRNTEKSTAHTISEDLAEAGQAWRSQVTSADVHYLPFTDAHITTIFEPKTYLVATRDPDYFWTPLLALHLFVRLGDVVNSKVCDIGQLPDGIWYIDITPDDAKNRNSVRRLPITNNLIQIGFLRYVEHVKALGAEYLFPHRNRQGVTAQHDPSKNASRRFGEYLDSIGISDPLLVFHSFRHTGISAMQDAGVPLATAMQIAGHEAQDHAVRTNMITPGQARSVHMSVYTHAELERLGTAYPLAAMKSAMETSIKPSIDLSRLEKAADIVREHLVRGHKDFKAGWPPQNRRYSQCLVDSVS